MPPLSKTSQLKKKKGTKKTDRKRVIKRLDDLVREIIALRDKKCVCCGRTEGLQVGHYVTRRVYALRWNLKNCNAQCGGCNLRHNFDPVGYTRFMIDTHGKQVLDELFHEQHKVTKMTNSMLLELEKSLQIIKGAL